VTFTLGESREILSGTPASLRATLGGLSDAWLNADDVYEPGAIRAAADAFAADGGVDVVYDSVGKDTFDKSLNSLRPRGYLALFGFSSGPVAPFDVGPAAASSATARSCATPRMWRRISGWLRARRESDLASSK